MVLKLVGGRSKIVFKPLPQDDPTQRQPDITVARSTLGWEPKVPLQEGLERTIAYFKTLLHTDNGA
jgi:UDP-glucuronate decarboxylase